MRDLNRLDWNLIPALDALLSERNVSRAAVRLGVTQPSASASLARLRRMFGDQLMVRSSGGYTLTPLGEQLARSARSAVETAAGVLDTQSAFAATTSTREFTIAASDYVQLTLGTELQQAVAAQAPSARVQLVSPFSLAKAHKDVLPAADGWIAPREMLTGENHSGTLTDRWVCVVDEAAGFGDHLTLDDLRDAEWVAPTVRGEVLRLLTDGLNSQGLEVRVTTTTDTFAAVPFLVRRTRRVGLVQERLAMELSEATNTRLLSCPWPVQALQLTLWWDRQWATDGGHVWLRAVVADILDRRRV